MQRLSFRQPQLGLLKKYVICCRGRTKPPIEPVGQSAFSIIRPNALCLHNLNYYAPHDDHFHVSNGKRHCMLRQCIAGGYINPPLPAVKEINWCKHDATTPSGCACHPSTGGELAVRYFFNSPIINSMALDTACTITASGGSIHDKR